MSRRRSKGAVLLLVKAAVTIALLTLIFSFIPFRGVAEKLLGADLGYVLVGLAMTPLTLLVGAVYTRMLAERQGLTLTIGQIVHIGYVTQFYGLFVPGVIAGGAIRWYKFARTGGKPVQALTTIAFGRLLNLTVGGVIGLGCWLLDATARENLAWGVGLAATLCVLAGGLWLLFHRDLALATGAFVDARRWIPEPVRGAAVRVLASAAAFGRLGGAVTVRLFALTAVEHVLGIISFVAFASAVGIELAPISIAWVRTYLMLLALLPITLGGVGAREGGLLVLLAPYGVAPELAVTFGLLLFARRLFSAAVGAALEAWSVVSSSVGGSRRVASQATAAGDPQ